MTRLSNRNVALLLALVGSLALSERASGQLGSRPSSTPPASTTPPTASAGSRFAAPPASTGTDRLPATSGSGTGGLIGGGSSGAGGGLGSSPAIPRTGSPGGIGSTGSGIGGGVYGGALPSTTDSGAATGGSSGIGTSPLGSSRGSGGASIGSSGGSSLGTPSAIPRTPSTSGAGGGYPYESQPADEPAPSAAEEDAPAIGSRSGDAIGMNGIETKGYALIGPTAHHYIFGNLAVADYIDRGQRRIVTLEQELDLPKADPNFLYYREVRDGNRWAFATKAGPDRRYAVYFQSGSAPASSQPSWRRFQRAQLQWSRKSPQIAGTVMFE